MNSVLQPAIVERLLTVVANIADAHAGLAERRQSALEEVGALIDADCGVWAWGRGWPDSDSITPVAQVQFGIRDEQRGVLLEWALAPETNNVFRARVRAHMGDERRATSLWQDVYTAEEWNAIPHMRQQMSRGGWSSWLHSVRYGQDDTWSNFFFLRNQGKPDFGVADAALVDLVLNGLPWMHSTAEERLPPESFHGLTPRQRMVMLMLLEGLPRKTIASRLGITEDTVGDHLKSIYAHFGVNSATELASHFLRGA